MASKLDSKALVFDLDKTFSRVDLLMEKGLGLAGFEPTTLCPPVKCRLFVAVRWCSFFLSFLGCEHTRTQANISEMCSGGGISGGTSLRKAQG